MIYRDPYERLVSGFLDTYHRNFILKHENVNNINVINFYEFVEFLSCINIKNPHFIQQTHNITTDNKMDILINVNNINQISNLLNIKVKYHLNNRKSIKTKILPDNTIPYYLINISLVDNYIFDNYSLFYSENIIKKVRKIYNKDIIFFKKTNINLKF